MPAEQTSHPEQPAERPNQEFERLVAPLRREINLHCYRMMGSVHEAEDLVQETCLRAWRHFADFDGRSFRAWLYTIATHACLNAIERLRNAGRLLPDQDVAASPTARMPDASPSADVAWLEPLPDSALEGIADAAPNAEARYAPREAVQLAFVAAIQQLPPRQRVGLLLCDVLGWSAAEAASLLGSSPASVNSALQRARERLASRYPDGRPATPLQPSASQRALLDRYLRAWEGHDLNGFVALLKEDASFTMPPWDLWYASRGTIRDFFEAAWKTCNGLHLVPIAANGQPAFAVYEQTSAGDWAAHSIHVLSLAGDAVARLDTFVPPAGPGLFDAFGLSSTLPRTIGTTHAALP